MKILFARSFYKSSSALSHEEQQRCEGAIERFKNNRFHPSLNYERLGSEPHQNHCSIRASNELRVILGVEPDFQNPETVVLAYVGHHDEAYAWAERRDYRTDPKEAIDLREIQPVDTLAGVLANLANFTEWQLFLHSDQERFVQEHYGAEARFRGAVGTGKTVVGLHRANYLGWYYYREGGRVLFTTYSRSLTQHLMHLCREIPGAAPNVEFSNIDQGIGMARVQRRTRAAPNVEFSNIDQVARGIARRANPDGLDVDPEKVDAAFDAAYLQTIPGTPLANCPPGYLREEIQRVIKGRSASKAEYLDTGRFERLGRKRGFNRAERELCWQLLEAWDERMREAGTLDFADVILLARDAAQRQPPQYRVVIIDEAQDMTLAGMQLARALVAGSPGNSVPPDGLLMIDDAAQRIYAGGYRVKWAGLNFKGRSFLLKNNYRNTKPVVEAAKAIRGDVLPIREDNDDGAALDANYLRTIGPRPVFARVPMNGEIPAIANRIRDLKHKEMSYDAIGVLTRQNSQAELIANELRQHFGIPCALLKDLAMNRIESGVRVGTFDRSKGLEFSAVLIPYLGASAFPEPLGHVPRHRANLDTHDGTGEKAETRHLVLTRLYVAMTRARDEFCLIADEDPCVEIQHALNAGHFDIRSA